MKKYVSKNEKWKNRMYGYHGYLSSTCSEQSNSIQLTTSSETCAQLLKNIFIFFNWEHDGHDLLENHGFGVLKAWKNMKWVIFTRSQHPHNQKLCGKRSISTQKHPTKKNFFAENVFSQYFPLFSTPQHLDFRDFADLGMCPSLHLAPRDRWLHGSCNFC